MRRKDLNYITIVVMFLSGLYTAITGLVMHLLDLQSLAFHHYAGYACTVLMGIHLIFNWKKLEAFLKRRV